MSDYWGDDSVAIMYFLLCHRLQLTHCLFTCHASEYHQNSMLIDKYMLSFLLLLAHLLSLVWRHVWITIWVKPSCLAFTEAPPRTIICVKVFWFVYSYFWKGKHFKGEWCFGWGVFHLHILYGLLLIEIRFMAPVWTVQFSFSRAATAGFLLCC